MPLIKLSAHERRRFSAFFTCLLLAGLAWILTTLSNQYNFRLREVLTYKNTPQKRAFHSLQSDTIEVTVRGSGWQMLFSGMGEADKQLPVDLHTLENRNYVVLNDQLRQLNNKKVISHEIVSFNPDTLYFDFSNREIKKVPVQLVSAVRYQRQFAQSDDIVVKPAFVTVNGPANVVDKITAWKTDTLKGDSINESISKRLRLQSVKEGNLTIYPKTVQVDVPVEEFTEKTIEVPVKVLNNTQYYNLKIIPQKVKITFTTSLSKYADTGDDLFEASIDLNLWRHNGYSVLPVKLTRQPAYCRVVKIEPRNIDFIIRK
jgi:YbbR domain-containing protein